MLAGVSWSYCSTFVLAHYEHFVQGWLVELSGGMGCWTGAQPGELCELDEPTASVSNHRDCPVSECLATANVCLTLHEIVRERRCESSGIDSLRDDGMASAAAAYLSLHTSAHTIILYTAIG